MQSDGAALLIFKDQIPVEVQQFCVDPGAPPSYVEHFAGKDILLQKYGTRHSGMWLDTEAALSGTDRTRNEYYVDFMSRYKMRHIRTLILEERRNFTASLSFHNASISDNSRFVNSAPVVTLAAAIQDALLRKKEALNQWVRTAEAAFDTLGEPICFVDDHRELVSASQSAMSILTSGATVRLRNGRLWHPTEKIDSMLKVAFDQAARNGKPSTVAVPLMPQGFCMIDVALSRHRPHLENTALLMVRLRMPRERTHRALDVLCHVNGITPSEALVLRSLVDGRNPSEISADHGISINTVRKQIAMLLQKTGCARQVDLVRLALSLR